MTEEERKELEEQYANISREKMAMHTFFKITIHILCDIAVSLTDIRSISIEMRNSLNKLTTRR